MVCRTRAVSAKYSLNQHTHIHIRSYTFLRLSNTTPEHFYIQNKKNYSLFTYYLAVTDLLFICLFMGEGIKIDMIYYNIFLLIERQENQK